MRADQPFPEQRVQELLRDLVQAPTETASAVQDGLDAVYRAGDWRFFIEYKTRGDPGVVANAIEQLRAFTPHPQDEVASDVPLVVVPRMGPGGRELCTRAGVSWLDLDGNANIVARGLQVRVEGRPKWLATLGRKRRFNPFTVRTQRLARVLLVNPDRPWTQSELAERTLLDKSQVSTLIRQLAADGYLTWDSAERVVTLHRPGLLLQAWREHTPFFKNAILGGVIPARSGAELLVSLGEAFDTAQIRYVATGLAAAWQYTRYADFRLVTFYLEAHPPTDWLAARGFAIAEAGANVWLVATSDEGILSGATPQDGIPCVAPVQAYVDLAVHPERADDAAAELRRRRLPWAEKE